MTDRETLRDRLPGAIAPDLIREREAAGWRMVAVEWERERSGAAAAAVVDVPFGFRVAGDCAHLEENPDEGEVLRTVMQGVVNDRKLSSIAEELNSRGFRTRDGERWNPAGVFRLMPALVENGPRIFSDPQWPALRKATSTD